MARRGKIDHHPPPQGLRVWSNVSTSQASSLSSGDISAMLSQSIDWEVIAQMILEEEKDERKLQPWPVGVPIVRKARSHEVRHIFVSLPFVFFSLGDPGYVGRLLQGGAGDGGSGRGRGNGGDRGGG